MRHFKKIAVGSFVVGIAVTLTGCSLPGSGTQQGAGSPQTGDTAWTFEKTIPQPITSTGGSSTDMTLGNLDTNKVSVVIPKGALDADTEVRLANPDTLPKYVGSMADTLGAPIEISLGKPTRLNEPAIVSFKIPADKIPAANNVDHLRVTYYDGTEWEYIKPDKVDLASGVITFSTFHFSQLGATVLKGNDKIKSDWVKSQVLDNTLNNKITNLSDVVSKKAVDMSLEKMGITDQAAKDKVLSSLMNSDDYKQMQGYYTSDNQIFSDKLKSLVGKKIAAEVPIDIVKNSVKALGVMGKVEAGAKALGYMAEGDYTDAAKVITEKVADGYLITAAAKVAVAVTKYEIKSWKNAEIEAAYTAFKNGSNAVFYGYNVDKGDFNAVWDQMRGVGRQVVIEAIDQENAVRKESGLAPLSADQADAMRNQVKESYRAQFTSRVQREAEMAAEQEKLQKIMDAMDKAGFLDETTAPSGLGSSLDVEGRLNVLNHFVEKMMKDTNRFDLTDKTGLIADKAINVGDLVQGASFFFGPDGKQKYKQFLKDRFNISMAPALKDLAGTWTGSFTIKSVDIPQELKDQNKGKTDENGCDFNIDLSQLIGKSQAITLTITPTGDTGGTIAFSSKGGSPTTAPFTYTNGVITTTMSQKGAVVTMTLNVDEDTNAYTAGGPLNMTYAEGKVKIAADVSATKPIVQTATQPNP